MGVWGAGNFANDEALDYAHELVDQMIEQVEEAVASEHGLEPDEPDSARVMCNVELMWLIGQHAGLSMPEAETVEGWRDKYIAVWDEYIDGLDPTLCPHTGTPVPGGLSFHEAVSLAAGVVRSGRKIVGLDLMEVAPGPGGDDWDGNVGARLLYKMIGWTLKSRAATA